MTSWMFDPEDKRNTFFRNFSNLLVVDMDTISQRTWILNFGAHSIDITL